MPQNRIQFQPGMSLNECIQRFGTEAQCVPVLERSRWPQGFACPHCGGREHSAKQISAAPARYSGPLRTRPPRPLSVSVSPAPRVEQRRPRSPSRHRRRLPLPCGSP